MQMIGALLPSAVQERECSAALISVPAPALAQLLQELCPRAQLTCRSVQVLRGAQVQMTEAHLQKQKGES
jgi:hypothetical protein